MKIALVILHADPARGGAERYTADLADALVARGHSVAILAGDGAPSQPHVVTLGQPGLTRMSRFRNFQQLMAQHLATERYDVVHAMLPMPDCDVYHPHAGIAAEAVRAGTRLSRWGNRFNRRRHAMAAAEREMLSSANPPLVLCLSNYLKQTFRRHYPEFDERRLVRLFNGTDLQRFDPAARPQARGELRQRLQLADTEVAALMMAQDFERKGLRQTITALSKVSDRRLKLVVAGKQDPARYRVAAAALGVADRIVFAGPTTDPYAFYRAADFFVLPTRHDPCSLVVLEALAMGVPVISTVNNGACEVMEPGRHGFVLSDAEDIDALAAAMRSLLDPTTRRTMSEACLALRPVLSQQAHLDTLEAAYRLVLRCS